MINVSKAFKEKLAEGELLYEVVDITFENGTKKTLEDEILVDGGGFTDCAESSIFPIGATVCKTMTLSLDNTEDQWKDYYFYKAKLTAYLKMQISDDEVETIKKGTYTITTPEQYGETLEFTALDDMYKANATYTSKLALPQTAFTILRDACSTIGISMGFASMEHGDLIISSLPDQLTFRQLIGWIAMLDCANARIDVDGYLQLIKWNFADVAVDYGATVDSEGYISFGSNADIDSEHYITTGNGSWYVDTDGYLTLREGVGNPQRFYDYMSSPTLSSDDIVITGIKLKNSENELLYGKEGYVLELENDLVETTDLGTVAAWIGDSLIGASFRSLEGDLAYNPLSEFGDMAYTYDRNDNKYITPITDISSGLNGITTIKTQAEDPVRGSSKFLSDSEKTLIAAKKLINKEKTEREQAVENLQNALKDSSGMYETVEILEDKSTITYLHDKPTLEESKNVIKFTAEAIGVSNDGGKTYPYGFILTGTTITKLLYAEGIDASYINSGTFTVKDGDGNILFMADIKNKKVYIDGSVEIGNGVSLNDIKKTAEDAQSAAALAKNMTMQLSNEYQGVPVDSDGNYETFPAGVSTSPVVMYGSQNITGDCTFSISKSDSVTGTWNDSNRTYTVTGLSADSGWVDIRAAYLNSLIVTKRFTIVKQYAGEKGEDGEAGRTYFIQLSANTLKRGQSNVVAPSTVTASAYYRDGKNAARTAYAGRWKVETSTNGTTYTEASVSTEDESTKTFATGSLSDSIVAIRFTLYEAGGTENPLDMQSVPILIDVSALTHEQIFNLLTDDGAIKGLYKEGNQLYVSFTYAKGGVLSIGGKGNVNGIIKVFDTNDEPIANINSQGTSIYTEYIDDKNWDYVLFDSASANIRYIHCVNNRIYQKILVRFNKYDSNYNIIAPDITVNDIDVEGNSDIAGNESISGTLDVSGNTTLDGTLNVAKKVTASNGLTVTNGVTVSSGISSFKGASFSGNVAFSGGKATFYTAPAFRNLAYATSGMHLVLGSDGVTLYALQSSSMRYKVLGRTIDEFDIENAYKIKTIWAKYKKECLSKTDERYDVEMPMFLAEDIEQKFPIAVDHKDGKAENWNYRVMIPLMFAMIKNDHGKVVALEEENKELKTELNDLKKELQDIKDCIRELKGGTL